VESCILKNKDRRQGKLNIDLTYIFVTCINQGLRGNWVPPGRLERRDRVGLGAAGGRPLARWTLVLAGLPRRTGAQPIGDGTAQAGRSEVAEDKLTNRRSRAAEGGTMWTRNCRSQRPERRNTQGVLVGLLIFSMGQGILYIYLAHMGLGPLASRAQLVAQVKLPRAGPGHGWLGNGGPEFFR